jgi:hypothetical protein
VRHLIILGVFIAVVAIVSVLLRQRRSPQAGNLVDRMLRAYGSARCVEAVTALEYLANQGITAEIAERWQQMELPLLQALPDCPPENKVTLREALEKCSKACSHRDTARSIMTMRDALVA